MEIEKKFLVKEIPDLTQYKHVEIEQAYLNRNPVLRIRKKDDKYIFTYKLKSKDNTDLQISKEIEEPLTEEAYYHLREKADNHVIEKTRYLIPLENNLLGEYDVFHGRLEGLNFIEVEFPDEESAMNFVAPAWFGKDVTSDKRYRNGFLTTVDKFTGFEM